MITNKEIKYLKSLSQKKYRKKYNQFLIEGYRLIKELLESNNEAVKIWVSNKFLLKHENLSNKIKKYEPIIIDSEKFSLTLNTENPQEIMALLDINKNIEIDVITKNILILDGVSDPGNLGTILRSAVWYGITDILLINDCVDLYNPKVVRSAMGAHYYIRNINFTDIDRIYDALKKKGYSIIGASTTGNSYTKYSINSNKWALVLGSESHGISKSINNIIDVNISIPKMGNIESLNVAIAGSILLDRLTE